MPCGSWQTRGSRSALRVSLRRASAPVRRAGIASAAKTLRQRAAESPTIYRYHPKYARPAIARILQKHLVAGGDAFPEEKEAEELAGSARRS